VKIELDLPPKLVKGLRQKSSARGLSLDAYAAEVLAEDNLTPDQRRTIDARLAEGLNDLKSGRCYGPFSTQADLMACLKSKPRKRTRSRSSA
jgi:hypothetical protein